MNEKKDSRRRFLTQGAALIGGATSAALSPPGATQELAGQPWERVYGAPFTGYGQPSKFEAPVVRHIGRPYGDLAPGSGSALSPIESLEGTGRYMRPTARTRRHRPSRTSRWRGP